MSTCLKALVACLLGLCNLNLLTGMAETWSEGAGRNRYGCDLVSSRGGLASASGRRAELVAHA